MYRPLESTVYTGRPSCFVAAWIKLFFVQAEYGSTAEDLPHNRGQLISGFIFGIFEKLPDSSVSLEFALFYTLFTERKRGPFRLKV